MSHSKILLSDCCTCLVQWCCLLSHKHYHQSFLHAEPQFLYMSHKMYNATWAINAIISFSQLQMRDGLSWGYQAFLGTLTHSGDIPLLFSAAHIKANSLVRKKSRIVQAWSLRTRVNCVANDNWDAERRKIHNMILHASKILLLSHFLFFVRSSGRKSNQSSFRIWVEAICHSMHVLCFTHLLPARSFLSLSLYFVSLGCLGYFIPLPSLLRWHAIHHTWGGV